jgi:membrane protein required for colicin V production
MVLDSRVGALDRTLGFLFGLGRGLIIVVVAYMFFDWLVADPSKPEWVLRAKSKVVLSETGKWFKDQLPDNAVAPILNRLKKPRPGDIDTPDNLPDQRSDLDSPGNGHGGYDRLSRVGMQQLLETKGTPH